MRTVNAMQDSRVVEFSTGEHVPQGVLSEPVSVAWVTIGKAVNAMAYRHYLKILSVGGIGTIIPYPRSFCVIGDSGDVSRNVKLEPP